MPAHALALISKDFSNWSNSGMSFSNVSDRPRNPSNQADAIELEAMAWFRANPEVRERMVPFRDKDGRSYYHFSTPIYVEKYCLKCHGDEEAAPPTIRDTYDPGFNYKVGDLRGIVSIKLPADEIEAAVWRDVITTGIAYILTMLASMLTIYLWLNRRVLNPLKSLSDATAQVATGDFNIQLPAVGQDEKIGSGLDSKLPLLSTTKIVPKLALSAQSYPRW